MSSADRIITLRLQRKQYSDQKVERYISYNASRLDLTDKEYDDLLSKIPPLWNTDKDVLLYFVLFSDKTFLAQREKTVYNYAIKDTELKLYNFDSVSVDELNSFVSLLVDQYTRLKIQRTENFYDEIISKISDISYMKYEIVSLREKLLKETDYIMMPDYPLPEDEKAEWAAYRQNLRDITTQEAWINNDYINIKIPVSPRPKDQIIDVFSELANSLAGAKDLPENLLDSIKDNLDGMGISNIIEKFSEISIKTEILRGIARLKIPTGVTLDELNTIDSLIPKKAEDILPPDKIVDFDPMDMRVVSSWQDYLSDLDEKISTINNKLASYNLDFTIADIIAKVSEDIKQKADRLDAEKAAEQLLQDLTIESLEGDNLE